MSLASLDLDPQETVLAIVERSRTTVRQLESGQKACEGQAPPHLLTGLHLWLKDLGDFWGGLGLLTLDGEGRPALTDKGLQVQEILSVREGDPSYDLLSRFMETQAMGKGLIDQIEAAIGPTPAQYVLDPVTGRYEINRMILPDLAAAIQSVRAAL